MVVNPDGVSEFVPPRKTLLLNNRERHTLVRKSAEAKSALTLKGHRTLGKTFGTLLRDVALPNTLCKGFLVCQLTS